MPRTDDERQQVVAQLDELYAATLIAVHEERACARRCLRQYKQLLVAENQQPRIDPNAHLGGASESSGAELKDDGDDEDEEEEEDAGVPYRIEQ